MAKSHKSNYLIWGLALVGIIGLLYASSGTNDILVFQLTPLTIAGENCGVTSGGDETDKFCGNIEFEEVSCIVKTTNEGYDKDGKLLLRHQSTPFEKHPSTTLDLTIANTELIVSEFKVTPKLKCLYENKGNILFPEYNEMELQKASMEVFVLAQDKEQVIGEVWNNINPKVTRDVELKHNTEIELDSFAVKTDDLLKFLDAGEYESLLKFQASGSIDIGYPNFSTLSFNLDVPQESIQTFVTLDVSKDEPQTHTPEPVPDCEPNERLIDNKCVIIPECNDDQFLSNNVCKDKDDDDEQEVNVMNFYEELTLCLQTMDINCLLQQKFIPLYAGSFGVLFLLGAVTTRNKPMFDQFGNRV